MSKTTSSINVDYPTYQELRKTSQLSNGKPIKVILNELAIMASGLLLLEERSEELSNIEKLLLEASTKYEKSVRDNGYRSAAVTPNYQKVLSRLRGFYNLSYNQLIRALLPFYQSVLVIHCDEKAVLTELVGIIRAEDPDEYRNFILMFDSVLIRRIKEVCTDEAAAHHVDYVVETLRAQYKQDVPSVKMVEKPSFL